MTRITYQRGSEAVTVEGNIVREDDAFFHMVLVDGRDLSIAKKWIIEKGWITPIGRMLRNMRQREEDLRGECSHGMVEAALALEQALSEDPVVVDETEILRLRRALDAARKRWRQIQ
jgi:hypothetical protein